MRRRLLAALAASAALLLVPSTAVRAEDDDEEPDYTRDGLYGSITPIFAFENFDNGAMARFDYDRGQTTPEGFTSRDSRISDDAWGVNVRLGYRLHPAWAAEWQFEGAWKFKTEGRFDIPQNGQTSPSSRRRIGRTDSYVTTANLRFYPFTEAMDRVQPYVVAGLGSAVFVSRSKSFGTAADDDRWHTDPGWVGRAGLGVDVYGNEHWALTVEGSYVVPRGQASDFQYGSVAFGFLWR